jgi:chloramphenicol 3-O-phosphotransferase
VHEGKPPFDIHTAGSYILSIAEIRQALQAITSNIWATKHEMFVWETRVLSVLNGCEVSALGAIAPRTQSLRSSRGRDGRDSGRLFIAARAGGAGCLSRGPAIAVDAVAPATATGASQCTLGDATPQR